MVGALLLVGASGRTPPLQDRLLRWYEDLAVPAAAGMSFDRFAVVAGGLAFLRAHRRSVVVAAKGLLRFPELQRGAARGRVDALTEYFLVGSLTSWLLALLLLPLT